MSRLSERFAELKQQNRAALITFLTAGDPDYEQSLALLKALPEAGADIIELGMPFSDPMADGSTIQNANLRALAGGQTLARTLQLARDFRAGNADTPLVLMGYFNPIHRYGVPAFVEQAKASGVDGLILVDLPVEHDAELCAPAQAAGLDFIRLCTPTTDENRLPQVLAGSSGFIYYVSVAGITGTTSASGEQVQQALARLRRHSPLPLAVGFGIRTPEQAAQVARLADAVVVGSALVEKIESAASPARANADVLALCRILADAVRKARNQ